MLIPREWRLLTLSYRRFPIPLKSARMDITTAGDVLYCNVVLVKLLPRQFHKYVFCFGNRSPPTEGYWKDGEPGMFRIDWSFLCSTTTSNRNVLYLRSSCSNYFCSSLASRTRSILIRPWSQRTETGSVYHGQSPASWTVVWILRWPVRWKVQLLCLFWCHGRVCRRWSFNFQFQPWCHTVFGGIFGKGKRGKITDGNMGCGYIDNSLIGKGRF